VSSRSRMTRIGTRDLLTSSRPGGCGRGGLRSTAQRRRTETPSNGDENSPLVAVCCHPLVSTT
jgi:hypothetical protein